MTFRVTTFPLFSRRPLADRHPCPIPLPLLYLLLDPLADLTSLIWRHRFNFIFSAAMKRFHQFGINYSVFNPFPVSEYLLCCYTVFLAEEGLSPQMVKSYISALRNAQLSLGLPDLRDQSSLPVLKRVHVGISRERL